MATTPRSSAPLVFPAELAAFCVGAMRRAGLAEEAARRTAEVLVTTDAWGTHTHGTKQLRGLMKNVRAGRLDARAAPELVGEGPAWGVVDGHDAMPMVTSCMAMETAIHKARSAGLAYVGVRRSGHFGAAGYYANLAARQGMIGIAMCNVEPFMTVPGARGRVLGTNPIAYAVPAGKERTLWLDIATSAVAVSKIFAARMLGQTIPDNWLVDAQGLPTTDPRQVDAGAVLPMAGHKGYGLAVLVEVLSAGLTGAAMLSQVQSWALDLPDPSNQGHAFLALNVAAMMPLHEFQARMDAMIREIRQAPRAAGAERIYLPGEKEWERWDRAQREGIALPEDVLASLRGLAADTGMEFDLVPDKTRHPGRPALGS